MRWGRSCALAAVVRMLERNSLVWCEMSRITRVGWAHIVICSAESKSHARSYKAKWVFDSCWAMVVATGKRIAIASSWDVIVSPRSIHIDSTDMHTSKFNWMKRFNAVRRQVTEQYITQIVKNDQKCEFWLMYGYKLKYWAPTDHRTPTIHC